MYVEFSANTVELDKLRQANSQILIFLTMPTYITITRSQMAWLQ